MPKKTKQAQTPKIEITQDMLDLGLAQMVTIALVNQPEGGRQTQALSFGKNLEDKNPVKVIAHLCEGLGFMLSHLRELIKTKQCDLTPDEFNEELKVIIKHITEAAMDPSYGKTQVYDLDDNDHKDVRPRIDNS